MKFKTTLLALFVSAAAFAAVPAQFAVSFDPVSPLSPDIEFQVESKQADGSWLAVAKGASSPIVFAVSIPFGNYTVRVKTRELSSGYLSEASNEATIAVGPGAPINVRIEGGRTAGDANPAAKGAKRK